MIATGLFTESLALDLTVIGTILGGFATVIGMLASLRAHRADEIKTAVSEIINASPDRIVVSPQPMLVEMKRDFVPRDDFDQALRRIEKLEERSRTDKEELLARIAEVPAQTVVLLKQTKGLL